MNLETKVLVVDDEPDAIKRLEVECSKINANVVASTTNPLEAINLIRKTNPDLVLLDIQMPQMNGIDLLKEIAKSGLEPTVVMTTAYDSLMLEAFRNNAFDFLLKPVGELELIEVVERYWNNELQKLKKKKVETLVNQLNKKIKIPSTYETHYFLPEQIFYLEADGKYTIIYQTNNRELTTSMNLGATEKILPEKDFLRVSKSYIVNLKYLIKINRRSNKCVLKADKNEIELPVSRKYTKTMEKYLF